MTKFKAHYFNHDFNAFMNVKIQDLTYEKGYEGYGIYWRIVEHLHNNQGEIKKDFRRISHTFNCKEELLKSIICDYDLFDVDEETISNNRVIEFLDGVKDKSRKAKESVEKRWNREKREQTENELKVIDYKEVRSLIQEDQSYVDNFYKMFGFREDTLHLILKKFDDYSKLQKLKYKDTNEYITHFNNWVKSNENTQLKGFKPRTMNISF